MNECECECECVCVCVCVCVLVVKLIQLVHTGGVNMRRDSCTIVWKSGLCTLTLC